MDLVIEQKCPSCGAAIVLHESDRLISCSFCDVKNYMVSSGNQRFLLPARCPADVSREDLVYIPYIRFKGCIYQCQGLKVRHAIIDTTRIALDNDRFALSLGLRPQAMQMLQATSGSIGRFVPQQIKLERIFAQAVRMTTLFMLENSDEVHHRAFIGETLSRIYLPVYVKDDMIVDAVSNREIIRQDAFWDQIAGSGTAFRTEWEPRFLSTLCPRCGAPMQGEADALVLHCRNCETMWEEVDGSFVALDWSRVPGQSESDLMVPFWKILIRHAGGDPMRSFADFLSLTCQPVVIRDEDRQRTPAFWIPACKLPPATFLQTAHYMTVSQKRLGEGEPGPLTAAYPVNLSKKEAVQSLKSVMAEAAVGRRNFFPLLPSFDLQSEAISLVYLPFRDAGHDRIERQTSITIAAAALKFGRTL